MPMPSPLHPALIASLVAYQSEHPDRICGGIAASMAAAIRLADDPAGPYAELYAHVEWTERAQEYIRAGEFRYISPEFDLDWQSEKDEQHKGAALLASGW